MNTSSLTETSTKEAMQTLTAQWYNAMATGLGLDPQKFQLYQGKNAMVTTSDQLWNIFDAVPPKSINNFLDPNSVNSFSQDYSLILNSLISNPDTGFETCMGDYLSSWKTYFTNNPPATSDVKGISDLFTKWAMVNAPSNTNCINNLIKDFINPISIALKMLASANGKFAWNKTISQLKTALAGSGFVSFQMDSAHDSASLDHTWANASASGFFDLFSAGGDASYDTIISQSLSAGITITASFQNMQTFSGGPYSQVSNDPILAGYFPWYSSAILSTAYTTKDNTVWDNQKSITWDKAFGNQGFLQRMTTAIIVADGIDIIMKSNASFNSVDQQKITTAASGGVWPFFSASGSGGSTSSVTFDDNGAFSIKTAIPKGNPQILGILQTDLSSVF